jgi:hypothetical protein
MNGRDVASVILSASIDSSDESAGQMMFTHFGPDWSIEHEIESRR